MIRLAFTARVVFSKGPLRPLKSSDLNYIVSIIFCISSVPVLSNTRRNGQPPKSQLAKRATHTQNDLKALVENFAKLTFWAS